MKKQIFSLFIVLLVLSGCTLNRNGSFTKKIFKTTNNKVIVTGTVYDAEQDNTTLPFVAIKSADYHILTKADRDGKYRIELKEGKYKLRTSYIGYKITSTKRLNLIKGDSLVIDFVLKDAHETLY